MRTVRNGNWGEIMTLNWVDRELNSIEAFENFWYTGRKAIQFIYPTIANTNTASLIYFSDFLHAKSSESHSCWHPLGACTAWSMCNDALGLQQPSDCVALSHAPSYQTHGMAALQNSSSPYCLFLVKQSVEKMILSDQPNRSPCPSPLYYPLHKAMGGKETWRHGNKACRASSILKKFFWGADRTCERTHTHTQTRMNRQALPSELDRSKGEKGKERNKETKASMNEWTATQQQASLEGEKTHLCRIYSKTRIQRNILKSC